MCTAPDEHDACTLEGTLYRFASVLAYRPTPAFEPSKRHCARSSTLREIKLAPTEEPAPDAALLGGNQSRRGGHRAASAGSRNRTLPSGRNSTPPSSRARFIAATVEGIGVPNRPSNLLTVVLPTRARRAKSRVVQPRAARAILHCGAVNSIRWRYHRMLLGASGQPARPEPCLACARWSRHGFASVPAPGALGARECPFACHRCVRSTLTARSIVTRTCLHDTRCGRSIFSRAGLDD
jgi:hypothetical protein